jgi:predicted PurR-regulated permease PerM
VNSGLSTLVGVALVLGALRIAQDVLMPLAVAVLVSFLLAPLVKRIERRVPSRALAVLGVVVLVSALLGGVGFVVGKQLTVLAAELPQYRSNLLAKARLLRGALGQVGEAAEDLERLERELTAQADARSGPPERPAPKVEVVPSRPGLVKTLRDLVAPVLGPAGTIGLVIVFTVFILLQREDLRDRMIRLSGGRDLSLTTQALDDAGSRVSRYLLTTTLLNAAHGTAIGLGLFWIGLPTAFLWGLLSMLLRFIPYLGPWIAAAVPIALSLAVFDGWTATLLTVGLFVSVELVSNNLLEPFLYGHRTGLSPFGVIVSAVFWAWLWDGVGLLLSVPLTVCLVVLGRHVRRLGFLPVLLADTPALAVETRLYQRLLAGDEDEAAELFQQAVKEGSLAQALDALALPVLASLARDAARGAIDAHQEARIRECLAEIVEEGSTEAEEPAELPLAYASQLTVLCVPARDANDELAARWLTGRLTARGFGGAAALSPGLVSEVAERASEQKADAVIISVASPGGSASVRALGKRLLARLPALEILVGVWMDPAGVERARSRGAEGVHFVATLSEAVEQLSRSAERLHLRKAAAPRPVTATA